MYVSGVVMNGYPGLLENQLGVHAVKVGLGINLLNTRRDEMIETLEQLAVRILKDIPLDKHKDFLDWAISGMPIRSEVEKQGIIKNIKRAK